MAHDVLAGVAAGDVGTHSRSPALRVTVEPATGAEDRIGVKIGQNAVREPHHVTVKAADFTGAGPNGAVVAQASDLGRFARGRKRHPRVSPVREDPAPADAVVMAG